jgi:hypothetical protein
MMAGAYCPYCARPLPVSSRRQQVAACPTCGEVEVDWIDARAGALVLAVLVLTLVCLFV